MVEVLFLVLAFYMGTVGVSLSFVEYKYRGNRAMIHITLLIIKFRVSCLLPRGPRDGSENIRARFGSHLPSHMTRSIGPTEGAFRCPLG